MTNIHPVAFAVITCSEDNKFLCNTPLRSSTGVIRQDTSADSNRTAIQWRDVLSSLDNDPSGVNSISAPLPPDGYCPMESFSNLCSMFTSVQAIADKVARNFFDATAPTTIALVQAKQPISMASNSQSDHDIQPGDTCWCLAVLMPPRHRKVTDNFGNSKNLVEMNLCMWIYSQDCVQLLDSIISCCVIAARQIDAAIVASKAGGSSTTLSALLSGDSKKALANEIMNHYVKVSKDIPRDIATFLPNLPDSWAGALRPPHAMVPLAHFVQNFGYPMLMPLFSLLCQGASLVFTHTSPAVASQCTIAARGLLYPFPWPHHFVPITTSTECWPFPLMKNVENHSNAFIAGVALSDLPALLIDHSKTPQPCELWIADCRYGTINRAAPNINNSRFSLHHAKIVNLSLPSNILLKDSWEKARKSLLQQTGSPREHLRLFPDVLRDVLNTCAGYWAECVIGQYRLGVSNLSQNQQTLDFDRFFYKFLLTHLSPAGLESDPDHAIRSLSMLMKQSDMIGKAFSQSIISLEMLTNARSSAKETEMVPFWRWGLGSIRSGKRVVRNKEQHDMYFFFRKCCEKFPELFRDDSATAAKLKESSGFFSKVENAFSKAKDSVRNSISEFSLDRHFTLLIPYTSAPNSGSLALMLKKPSEETAVSPKFLIGQAQQLNNMNPNAIQNTGSASPNNGNHYNDFNTPFFHARIEAQCRFFPSYLRKEHWFHYWPRMKEITLLYEQQESRLSGKEPTCTPVPLDLLCDFQSYHVMVAPVGVNLSSSSSSPNNGNLQQYRQQQTSSTNNSSAPTELLKISLPGNRTVSPASPAVFAPPTTATPQQQQPTTSTFASSPASLENSNKPSLFGTISLPNGDRLPTMPSALGEMPPPPPPLFVVPQQQNRPTNNNATAMTDLFGPSQEELERQKKNEKPKLDDFFG